MLIECLPDPQVAASPVADRETKSVPIAAVGRNDRAADVVVILARPLFQANRRPTEGSGAQPEASGPGRLTGILVSQGIGRLIFAGAAGGKPVVVTEGDHIGTDVVQSIATGQATLLGPDGLKTIRPSFSDAQVPKTASEVSANRPDHAAGRVAESRMSRHQPVH
jgi:hypothetical protein